MTIAMPTTTRTYPRRLVRSTAAVFVGFIAGSAGAIAAISMVDLGPKWYPIALALTGFPCVWLGGVLYGVRHPER